MRGLFAHIAVRWRAQGSITGPEAKALLRTMRTHRQALISGSEIPAVPRLITRRLRPTVLWALFRVSVETPGIFVMGLVAIPTALAIGVFRAAERLAHWLAPHVSQIF